MHPLARYLIPFGIALLIVAVLWWVLGPLVGYLAKFWPALAIAVGLGLLLWRFPTAQAQALLGAPIIRGIATALILTAIYGGLLWLGYVYVPRLMISELGISLRTTWLIVTILGLPVIPIIWRLYAATGIPGDPVVIGRGFRALALLILIFMGWWYHHQPNIFFDKGGKSQFWVAKSEGKAYFRPGHSPTTGEKLDLGTAEDAKKFSQQSWLKDLKLWWYGPAPGRLAAATHPVGGREIREISIYPDTWSPLMVPPPDTRKFRFRGPEGTLVRFADGTQGPLTKNFGSSSRWAEGFSFFNPTTGGKVVVVFDKI